MQNILSGISIRDLASMARQYKPKHSLHGVSSVRLYPYLRELDRRLLPDISTAQILSEIPAIEDPIEITDELTVGV